MKSLFQRLLKWVRISPSIIDSIAVDTMIMLIAYSVVLAVRFGFGMPQTYSQAVIPIALATILMLVMLYVYGVYFRIWAQTSGHSMDIIVQAVSVATLISLVIDYVIHPHPLPLSVVLVSNALSASGFVLVRYRSRLLRGFVTRWRAIWRQDQLSAGARTNTLVVGAGEAGQTLALRMQYRFPNKMFKIIGFVDDDPKKQGKFIEGRPVLGRREDVPMLAERYNVDLIVVAIHNIDGPNFRRILEYCQNTKARITVVPNVFALMNARYSSELLRDVEPEDLLGRKLITRHEAVDLSPVTDKVILVTGAAGSIGSELCRQLCSFDPKKLILLDVNESGLHDLSVEIADKAPNMRLDVALCDITARGAVKQVYEEHHPEVVFHAAAYKHVPMLEKFPDQAVQVNIGGTRNVAEAARNYGVQRFVMISTDKAVNPSNVMGATKRICEKIINSLGEEKGHSTLFTSVRFGNVLGSRGSVVPIFTRQINRGGPVTVTHPEMNRYFMTIPEASNLVIHAACLTKGNEIFLLKMGEVVKIVELAERMIRLRGMRPYIDIEIQFSGMRPGEKMHEQLYDGTIESARETVHPGIIQLNNDDTSFKREELMAWVDEILERGVSHDNALNELRWGLSSSEQFAAGTTSPEVIQPPQKELSSSTL